MPAARPMRRQQWQKRVTLEHRPHGRNHGPTGGGAAGGGAAGGGMASSAACSRAAGSGAAPEGKQRRKDIKCLDDCEFLNDTVIEFYFKCVALRCVALCGAVLCRVASRVALQYALRYM